MHELKQVSLNNGCDKSTVNAAQLAAAVDSLLPDIIRQRRFFHQRPELSGHEHETARVVAEKCREAGLHVRTGIGGHGILACLEIDADKPWIAFRADMDALPIQDTKQQPYASPIANVSHSCGHDAHTAILLATVKLVTHFKQALHCNIAFIFQPAEETCQGAAAMLKDGVFNTINPQQIYALHVYPYLPAGSIGFRAGPMCAAADMFEVEIHGRGGHAARPHECIDVILVASHVIQALHHIVSRRINPLHQAVLTIGQIHGGHAGNVIPDHIRFSGTFRSLHPEVHEEIRACMDHIIRQTAETWGATSKFLLKQATPVLSNNPELLDQASDILNTLTPDIKRIDIQEASMGGEDFAAFMQLIPGCLFRLGTGSSPKTRYPLHHPNFDIDESSLRSGVAAFTALALSAR